MIISLVYVYIDGENRPYISKVIYIYMVEITPSHQKDYIIYLPIPLTEKYLPSKIINDLKIEKGSGSFSLLNTSYGLTLEIKSKMHTLIRAYKEFINTRVEGYAFYTKNLSVTPPMESYNTYSLRNTSMVYYNSTANETIQINLIIEENSSLNRGNSTLFHGEYFCAGSIYKWELKEYNLKIGWNIINMLYSSAIADNFDRC